MVLVSYLLDNYISILQTKINHREGHEARRIGLEAMPLDQDIKGRHGERGCSPVSTLKMAQGQSAEYSEITTSHSSED